MKKKKIKTKQKASVQESETQPRKTVAKNKIKNDESDSGSEPKLTEGFDINLTQKTEL